MSPVLAVLPAVGIAVLAAVLPRLIAVRAHLVAKVGAGLVQVVAPLAGLVADLVVAPLAGLADLPSSPCPLRKKPRRQSRLSMALPWMAAISPLMKHVLGKNVPAGVAADSSAADNSDP